MNKRNIVVMAISVGLTLSTAARSVDSVSEESASKAVDLASWIALDAPTGHEHWSTAPLMQSLKGWNVDKTGNLHKTTGAGENQRVVACALDAHAFAVSQITPKGYLRLHHIGVPSTNKLWSQAHEGQHVRIITRQGPIVGVTAASNGHFSNLHRGETDLIRADDLWVDVGASSAQDVADMGINLLDPIVRQIPAWHYANEVAGPSAGARLGCAAVVAGAESGIVEGKTTWVLSSQSNFNWIGLSSAIAALKKVDEVIVLGKGATEATSKKTDFLNRSTDVNILQRSVDTVMEYAGVKSVTHLNPEVQNAGGLMEVATIDSAHSLYAQMMKALGAEPDAPNWIVAPAQQAILNQNKNRIGGGMEVARFKVLLDQLTEVSAVSGHEGPIRKIVMDKLPKWAKSLAQTDEIGNLWIDAGPRGQKATVFIAHMDEVGYEISSIADNGVVSLI